jgi:hypothetical protein
MSSFSPVPPGPVWNFAYGSNMSRRTLCDRRKIFPTQSIPGILEGYCLAFDLRGIPNFEPCFGNLFPCVDSEVHGVLHEMTAKEFSHLLNTEGASFESNHGGYRPVLLSIKSYDGRVISAYTLICDHSSRSICRHPTQPSERYKRLLTSGAAEFGLHTSYQDYLQTFPAFKKRKLVSLMSVIQLISLTILTSPIWLPTSGFYWLSGRKAIANRFVWQLIINAMWRLDSLLTLRFLFSSVAHS